MKKSNFSLVKLLCAAAFVVSVLALTGCTPEPELPEPQNSPVALAEDDGLIGTWTSTYGEVYKITKNSLSNGGSWGDTYAGNELVVLKDSESSGTIYIKYTRAMNPDWSYSEDAADVGKWYALNYKNLTADSVSISGAYKADGKSATDTLEEAVTEFTIENGYFGTYSECTK